MAPARRGLRGVQAAFDRSAPRRVVPLRAAASRAARSLRDVHAAVDAPLRQLRAGGDLRSRAQPAPIRPTLPASEDAGAAPVAHRPGHRHGGNRRGHGERSADDVGDSPEELLPSLCLIRGSPSVIAVRGVRRDSIFFRADRRSRLGGDFAEPAIFLASGACAQVQVFRPRVIFRTRRGALLFHRRIHSCFSKKRKRS